MYVSRHFSHNVTSVIVLQPRYINKPFISGRTSHWIPNRYTAPVIAVSEKAADIIRLALTEREAKD